MPQLQWEDTIEDGHNKINREQMRLTASYHMKYGLYKDPAFKFFQSMGMFNFFQGFKSDDLDLGVFHFYWDSDAENTIEYHDPKTGERTNNIKGDWRGRWYDPGEQLKPVKMDNPYRPDPVKMMKWWMETQASIHAKIMLKQKESAETEDTENEPWKYMPKPQWEN
jgi:hypothetical protein